MKRLFFIPIFIALTLGLFLPVGQAQAQETPSNYFCAVYFTGVGCPHCAKTDPVIFKDLLKKYPNLVILEYEIYQQRENASVLNEYNNQYQAELGIPQILLSPNEKLVGDQNIIRLFDKKINEKKNNPCLLLNKGLVDLENLDFNSLPGVPKIWRQNKILIKEETGTDNQLLKNLILGDNLKEILKDKKYEVIKPEKVALSGQNLEFENAIKVDNFVFQWNGPSFVPLSGATDGKLPADGQQADNGTPSQLTIAKIVSLALVDAINPCAFAVLILMLLTILTYDPSKRKNILWAGLAFVVSVFVMYFVYGIIIVKFFQIVQALTSVRLILYKILGVVAIVLGLLNLKDFIRYKPGGFLTEMPMFLRPLAKKFITSVTSPVGAFGVGAFVTLFLLPCTIGPYIICAGILCTLDFVKTLPYLLLYNLVFVLPMLIIVLIVYKGFAKVQDVSGWKDKNIRYLHLVSGLIMLGLGLAMLMGWA